MRVGLLVGVTSAEMLQDAIDHVKSFGFDFGQLCIWDSEIFTDETISTACNNTESIFSPSGIANNIIMAKRKFTYK